MTRYKLQRPDGQPADDVRLVQRALGYFETMLPAVYGLACSSTPLSDRIGGKKAS
jgi:hypothetical protein